MKLLLAEDDRATRIRLRATLQRWDYEVVEASDGAEAWSILQQPDAPRIAVMDWVMPVIDGLGVCQRLAERTGLPLTYIILVTQRNDEEDLVRALDSGAHDFLTKPVHTAELRSRLAVGRRLIEAERARESLIAELRETLAQVKTLRGLLPICAHCKKIRNDEGYWDAIESYVRRHSDAEFSHSICPECLDQHFGHLFPKKEEAPE